ncbi:hypothetical protein CLV63_116101 [Murinocardiopsis flavida]|uniref:Uncharacterized protein n=1 Tax=Murinocardiopsis flavida TaxID=645275 RepID=A0A2P8D8Z8_9ACTN|nr:hypothetical protein [Murinocardiopsis flavida]PSK93694.1 hypothetical protein CLV63_116101 [Murinocardiopsis flavida]
MTTAAIAVALAVLIGLAVMQVLIIAGRPVGEYAWGGQHRVATPRLRRAAAAAIVLYVGFALLLMSRAGVLPGGSTGVIVVATWVLFAYCAVAIVPNSISRSRRERLVQTPVSIVLAFSVLVIAAAPGA